MICVYSERFLSLLTAQERAALSLAPIEMPRGTRQRFFELRGPAHAHPVGVRGLQADGIECTTCGRRTVEVIDPRLLEDGLNLKTFISDAFLAPSPPPAMAVGQDAVVTLCLPRRRWTELAEHRDAAGLIARPIGVIEQAECDQNPRVRMRVVSCEVCKTWPMPLTIERRERAAFDLPATDCAPSNFDWLAAAESNGRLIIAAATIPAQAMFELAMRPGRPARTEFIAMRCPACWRLGWIVLSRGDAKLRLVWRYGLH
ncbi:MAG: hypothetical protein JNK25_15050 [Phycisphaerae bacterium]|nr:hypothetical protein [Phycisphaerae bacterium]